MNTTNPLRFHITHARFAVMFTPANEEAKAHLAKGRKCLHLWELEGVLKSGASVEINFNGYLGGKAYWVALTPSTFA